MITVSDPFTDLAKLFTRINVPGVDMASVISAHDGMQTLVHKQMEYLITTMREIQTAVQRTDVGGKPTVTAPQSHEFVAQTLHKAFDRMRELTNTAQISQDEALMAISEGGVGKLARRPRRHCETGSRRSQRRQSLHSRRPHAIYR
jgi:phasin family protein